MDHQYLGDGAYAAVDEFGNVLIYASDGEKRTNEVVMEPEVLLTFLTWLKRVAPEAFARIA